MHWSSHLEENLFGDRLNACRNVCVVLVFLSELLIVRRLVPKVRRVTGVRGEKQRFWVTGGTEEIDKLSIEGLVRRGMKREVIHIQFKATVRGRADQLVHLIGVFGLAERRHPHDLIFAFVHLETGNVVNAL